MGARSEAIGSRAGRAAPTCPRATSCLRRSPSRAPSRPTSRLTRARPKAVHVAERRREVKKAEYERDGKTRGPFINRLDLPEAKGAEGDYFTANEAAAILKVVRASMYSFLERGEIPGYKLGARTVFSKGDVLALQGIRDKKKEAGRSVQP